MVNVYIFVLIAALEMSNNDENVKKSSNIDT